MKSTNKRFRYHKRSVDSYEKRASQSAYGDRTSIIKDGVKTLTVHDGKNKVRFIPPTWDDAQHYGIDVHVHYGVGASEGQYLCPLKMKTADWCPICDEQKKAQGKGDEEYAKQLAPKKRVVTYVLDRSAEDDSTPLVWAQPFTVDKDIGKLCIDEETKEVISIDDPENGYDIIFHREGKGVNTKYSGIAVARKPSPLGSDNTLEYAQEHPLTEVLNHVEPEEIEKEFLGGTSNKKKKDDDEDEDDVPKSRKSKVVDEDDDEDDVKPARRSSKRDEDEEDDSDSDDSDEDEEEDDDPELTWRDLKGMSFKALSRIVTKEDLEIDLDDFDGDDDAQVRLLRKKIAKKLGIELPSSTAEKLGKNRE